MSEEILKMITKTHDRADALDYASLCLRCRAAFDFSFVTQFDDSPWRLEIAQL